MSRTTPKFRRKNPDVRREDLIEAALRCLGRDGHAGVSARRIAAEAGVSVGLINHYFPSIALLIAQAYETLAGGITSRLIEAAAGGERTPRQRLSQLIEASFAPQIMTPDLLGIWVVFWGLVPHSAEMQRVQKKTNLQYRGAFEQQMKAIVAESGAKADPGRLALGLCALMDGLWLGFCLDQKAFDLADGVALCEAWVEANLGSPAPPRRGGLH